MENRDELPLPAMRLAAAPTTRRSFEADPTAVGAARHFIRCLLDGDGRAGDAELIVSELATNAVRHARSSFTVAATLGKWLRIEVDDADAGLPKPRAASPDAVDGRGLEIVEAVACAWGTRLDPEGGKVVWAELGPLPTDRLDAPVTAARLHVLNAVPDADTASLDVAEPLVRLLERVTRLLDADTATVLLLDESTGLLRVRAARGAEEEVRPGVCIPIGVGFVGSVASRRQPVTLDRVDAKTVASPILWKRGICSLLGVPLWSGWDLLGVLHVGRLSERSFKELDVDLLELIGMRVAAAIDLELLEQRFLPSLPDLQRLAHAGRC